MSYTRSQLEEMELKQLQEVYQQIVQAAGPGYKAYHHKTGN